MFVCGQRAEKEKEKRVHQDTEEKEETGGLQEVTDQVPTGKHGFYSLIHQRAQTWEDRGSQNQSGKIQLSYSSWHKMKDTAVLINNIWSAEIKIIYYGFFVLRKKWQVHWNDLNNMLYWHDVQPDYGASGAILLHS